VTSQVEYYIPSTGVPNQRVAPTHIRLQFLAAPAHLFPSPKHQLVFKDHSEIVTFNTMREVFLAELPAVGTEKRNHHYPKDKLGSQTSS
jgi:hypothetical protein